MTAHRYYIPEESSRRARTEHVCKLCDKKANNALTTADTVRFNPDGSRTFFPDDTCEDQTVKDVHNL